VGSGDRFHSHHNRDRIIPASQIHLHRVSNIEEFPTTSAFNFLDTDEHLLTSQESALHHHHQRRARHHQQLREHHQHHQHQKLLQFRREGALPGSNVKTFEVCYTSGATTFLFVTPVPSAVNFTCADRLFDHPQFFNVLTMGPRDIQCPPGCFEGKIFANDGVYTVDSQVCMAGAHSSTRNGGLFRVTLVNRPDITDYPQETQAVTVDINDTPHVELISSLPYAGSFPTSFTITHVSS